MWHVQHLNNLSVAKQRNVLIAQHDVTIDSTIQVRSMGPERVYAHVSFWLFIAGPDRNIWKALLVSTVYTSDPI